MINTTNKDGKDVKKLDLSYTTAENNANQYSQSGKH